VLLCGAGVQRCVKCVTKQSGSVGSCYLSCY